MIVWHTGALAGLAATPGDIVVWAFDIADPALHPTLRTVSATSSELTEFACGAEQPTRIARRLLSRALIAHLHQWLPADVTICREHGQTPVVTAPAGWHISVAGRGAHHVIAVARRPIGVDTEPLGSEPPIWDMMTPSEYDALRVVPVSAQSRAWIERWVTKEAHCKRLGYARTADPVTVETRKTGQTLVAECQRGASLCVLSAHGGAIVALAQGFDGIAQSG
jgi:phosphopantetheinyl transferase